MARQRLGQHFLSDPDWREQIAREIRVSAHSLNPEKSSANQASRSNLNSNISSNENSYCWVEIGAGHGEMTEHLAAAGAPVYAIELDGALARRLHRLTQRYSNLTVIASDVLKVDFPEIAPGRRLRIYGNLPYYITSPILHRLFESAGLIDEMHIVIQLEVAERLVAQPGSKDYGYLSVVTQLYSRPELVLEIPREAFDPPPEVGSALVTLRFPGESAKLGAMDEEKFLDFVKACFAQKRKTLVNNLRTKAEPDVVRAALEKLGLKGDARGEQLSLGRLAGLGRELGEI
jgi:16S rRNA (adenine1518-N6/adenine1519-N6)-dimethyltransferase